MVASERVRLLLLLPKVSYRADDFLAAADRLGVEVILGSDRCHLLDEQGAVEHGPRESLVLDFLEPEASAEKVAALAKEKPLDGVVATDDGTTEIAALACRKLGLPHNPPAAARATRDKLALRERLAAGGVRQARFRAIPVATEPDAAARLAGESPGFPCVLKPRTLSASRGVIRADDERSFAAAFRRIASMLGDPEIKAHAGDAAGSLVVESFLHGPEVALEGLLTDGALEVLALFDKPDPLEGPYFEETLYVTPSRLPSAVQQTIADETRKAAAALGLREGPVHAELRVTPDGPAVLELAARSIGGLCSRTLRFGSGMSLEEVLVRHALRRAENVAPREREAAGVMMLPIPVSGVFRGVEGLEEARAVPGIAEITITALPGRELLALPEGSSYLGFAFARGDSPAQVEAALRDAHSRIRVLIAASLTRAT